MNFEPLAFVRGLFLCRKSKIYVKIRQKNIKLNIKSQSNAKNQKSP